MTQTGNAPLKITFSTKSALIPAAALALLLGMPASSLPAAAQSAVAEGQKLAFDRSKGNCLTCHDIKGGNLPGTIGPELTDIKSKYPDRNELVAILVRRHQAQPADRDASVRTKPHFERQRDQRDRGLPADTVIAAARDPRRFRMTRTKRWIFASTRRLILQGAASVALVGLGNIRVRRRAGVRRANDKYPEEAFKQKSDDDAIKLLYGKTAEKSDKVKLDAPEIAENGAVVPISVTTTLADVTSISFLVAENPNALVASYKIPAGTVPSVANRIKMAKTSNVIVVVEAGGKLYSTTKEVKVTVGGCGG